MIKLKENRVSIANLPTTLQALDKLDELLKHYGNGKPGPAYVKFRYVRDEPEVQIARDLMIVALQEQRLRLVEYLATLGIDAN